MNKIKTVFALLFAIIAVMLMSTAVLAGDYYFITQPQDITYGETSKVSYELNFMPTKAVELYVAGETEPIHALGGYKYCSVTDEKVRGKVCYLKVYYGDGENDFITSVPFNVFADNAPSKYRFIVQPQDVTYEENSYVSYELSFMPTKAVELYIIGREACIHALGGYARCSVTDKNVEGRICYLKVYYNENEYILSEPFNVYNSKPTQQYYAFTKQPKDVVYGETSYVTYELNFMPTKSVELYILGREVQVHALGGYARCSVTNQIVKDKICYLKVYYGDGENDYILSNYFNVYSQDIQYKFTEQPQDVNYSKDSTVSYKLNFSPVSETELWAIEYGCIHNRGNAASCPVDDAKAIGKTCYIKVYYGDGDYDYITSEPFNVTSEIAFTEQPKNIIYGKSNSVSYKLSFTPTAEIELWAIGVGFIHKRSTATACPIDDTKAIDRDCFIKVYYGDGDYDYITSDIFKVTCDYAFTEQPQDIIYGTDNAVSFKLNFTPTGNTELWTLGESSYVHNRGYFTGCPIDDESLIGKYCYIRAYYSSSDYVLSDIFKVYDRCIVQFLDSSNKEINYFYAPKGEEFTMPEYTGEVPIGKQFAYWVHNKDVSEENPYYPGDEVTVNEDMTFLSKFETKECKVTFDTGGIGSAPPVQTVLYNNKASYPVVDAVNGYFVSAWYADKECTEVFDFDTAINDDITLFAKWKPVNEDVSADITSTSTVVVYYGDDIEINAVTDETMRYVQAYIKYYDEQTEKDEEKLIQRVKPEELPIIFSADSDLYKKAISPEKGTAVIQCYYLTPSKYEFAPINLIVKYKNGDFNKNGKLNEEDAALLLKHLSGSTQLDEEQYARADINGDNKVDMLDVIAILNLAS